MTSSYPGKSLTLTGCFLAGVSSAAVVGCLLDRRRQNQRDQKSSSSTSSPSTIDSSFSSVTDPYDRLSKCVKITAEELFSGEDSKRRKPWFELSQKTILEKIKERNDAFEIYTTEKSISNLTKLRNSRSNLKEKKKEAN